MITTNSKKKNTTTNMQQQKHHHQQQQKHHQQQKTQNRNINSKHMYFASNNVEEEPHSTRSWRKLGKYRCRYRYHYRKLRDPLMKQRYDRKVYPRRYDC